jgi:Fe-S cluster biogenesis protein NfuA/nitrite reductase/ring-hydroxylating ferredoxin subunit
MSALLNSETAPDPAADLARIAGQITRLEEIARDWDEHHAGTLSAIKSSIEELNREAFKRLIRFLREDPACAARLKEAVRDPFIFGVLRFHELVKEPIEQRIERALEEIRPMLKGHGGDVELVGMSAADTVDVRLVGACHGCPASGQTLTEGVERAIRAHCPEIQHIRQVSQPPRQVAPRAPGSDQVIHFISPFARAKDEGWETICAQEDIPDNGILAHCYKGHDLLLYRKGSLVSCMNNACAHLGMPLDAGELSEGTLRCSYHGFTYLLETGECLTVPEVQLTMHPVKVADGQVSVRLGK